jgi:hypothetical protein
MRRAAACQRDRRSEPDGSRSMIVQGALRSAPVRDAASDEEGTAASAERALTGPRPSRQPGGGLGHPRRTGSSEGMSRPTRHAGERSRLDSSRLVDRTFGLAPASRVNRV